MGQKASLSDRIEAHAFLARVPMSARCRLRVRARAPVLIAALAPLCTTWEPRPRVAGVHAYDEATWMERWDTLERLVHRAQSYGGALYLERSIRHLKHNL